MPNHTKTLSASFLPGIMVSFVVITISLLLACSLLAVMVLHSHSVDSSPLNLNDQHWQQTFSDDFDGNKLDASKWESTWFGEGTKMNNVETYSTNVTMSNGVAKLQLASETSGALIHTGYKAGHYQFPVGSYIEAKIRFSGDQSGLYNWPAWWVNSTNDYPVSGEHDIAEVLDGGMTVNYHSPTGSHNQGTVPGSWGNNYHTYGVYRLADKAEVYYDRKLVKSYATDDDGQPLDVIFTMGSGQGKTVIGDSGALYIDYVRAWKKL